LNVSENKRRKKMSEATNTARVNTDTARIDKLKELYRSVPMQLDFERIRIMKDVYEENGSSAGSQEDLHRRQPLRRLHGR
jgi:hypothetical protein